MDVLHGEPKPGGQSPGQQQPIFDGVAVRSVVQQIGNINIGGMSQEQFIVLTQQLGQILQRLVVPEQALTGGSYSRT